MLESLFNKVAGFNYKNTYFEEHLGTAPAVRSKNWGFICFPVLFSCCGWGLVAGGETGC